MFAITFKSSTELENNGTLIEIEKKNRALSADFKKDCS
jgi:hypothetical protein